ncbi:MAG: glycosyltransferase [Candidatus Neomarinimicrobiota bacterium]|nr:glycosyltransferase [Candidatus Neomarinimicrobiota bacterium]
MIFILLAITIVYFLLFLRLRGGESAERPEGEKVGDSPIPSLSIIVAARDEEDRIGHLLDCLIRQTYPADRLEFIIVDDHSTDETKAIVTEETAGDSRFRLLEALEVPPNVAPKKWALTQGIDASEGTILLMTDADCTMDETWAEEMVRPFADKCVGMVLGSSPLGESNSPWDRAMRMDSIGLDALMMASAAVGSPFTASGRNLAVRRTAFDKVGGYKAFRGFASGDDDLLMHAMTKSDWKVLPCLAEGSEVESPAPKSVGRFFRQRLRFASKGGAYYRLDFVRPSFRLGLALIFTANLSALCGQLLFLAGEPSYWLIPWFVKMIADGLLITAYLSKTQRPFDIPYFFLNEVWHPLYVAFFGTLGPFVPVHWKGRRSTIHRSLAA